MIGIDIVNISRIKKLPNIFFKRIFTDKEISEANTGNFYEKIAGKWAAKEAAYKAGLRYLYKQIEILSENDAPKIYINAQKKEHLISISHEKQYAVAVVSLL
jgi:phosphopantetheine--protein transferase-like protein